VDNLGFAGGVNAGVAVARHEAVLLLNPDAEISADALRHMRHTLRSLPDVGAVGGCLVGEDGRPQRRFAVRRFPTLASWATDLLLIDDLWPGNPARRHYLAEDVPLDGIAPIEVEQPAAACLMVTRRALTHVGGLDERFQPAWFEDVDLCRRLRAAGFRVMYEPRALVRHEGGVSLRTLDRAQFARIWYRNMRRYAGKHHGRLANLLLRGLILAGMLLRTAVSSVRGDTAARATWLAVLRDTVRNADGLKAED
jgi:GT2 family glycosyltransferase